MKEKTTEPDESPLAQLRVGLLMLIYKQTLTEKEYDVIGRQTFQYSVVSNRHSYAGELERVLDELKLTAELLSGVGEKHNGKHKVHEPEELISYYNGVFLDAVHQAKDKLMRLIDYLAAEDGPRKRPFDEAKKVGVSSIRKKHGVILKESGIDELVGDWEENDKAIGVALRKRTKHHHFLSQLQLTDDYQKLRMSRTMLKPTTLEQLNEDGKKRMVELGEKSFKKYRDDVVAKVDTCIEKIEVSLDAIAEKLITYYKVPTDPAELAQIGVEYMDFLSSLNIKNETNISKLQSEVKDQVINTTSSMIQEMSDEVVSVYLAGSAARGEFIPGTSDLNLYIITHGYTRIFDSSHLPVTMYVISEKDLYDDKHKKDRFILWSDGVLMHGKKQEFGSKEFPKPGTMLTMLLNRGAIEKMEAWQKEIEALKDPDRLTLRLYSLKVARTMMDYAFGVAMSNKPFYSASRKKKIAHIKEVFPMDRQILIVEQIYYGGRIKHNDLKMLVEAGLNGMRRTFPRMEIIETEVLAGR
ncbi:MAG TPA: hypothetical protein VK502_02000 [Candidatus Saccharimonadales bacterium]|nr:hypothetical protein [Candidatus Saccharimonadales bacterium]